MNMHGLMKGATGEPPGAYAVVFTPDREPVSPHKDSDQSRTSQPDAYHSHQSDGADATKRELPEAIRNDSNASHIATCYCGHCPSCVMHKEAKVADRSTFAAAAEKLESTDSTDSTDAPEKEPNALTDAENRQVEALQRRDQEVRAHEQAHAAAGATNVRYEYQVGPDGRSYAVGGAADIQIVAMNDDHASRIAQAQKMRAAALAPGDPSPQDMAVAAKATRLEAEATADNAEAAREMLSEEVDADEHAFDSQSVAVAHKPFHALA